MLLKNDNMEIMISDKMKLWKEFLNHFIPDIKLSWEHEMKDSDFIIYCVHLLYYKSYKINFKCRGSYIDSHHWIKNKIAFNSHINP